MVSFGHKRRRPKEEKRPPDSELLRRAKSVLGISQNEILDSKVYKDKVVIVKKDGKKEIWPIPKRIKD